MSEPNPPIDFIDELRWRGLLHQCTDEQALVEHLSTGPRLAYAGFDPTANSLTIGNLVPLMVLKHFQRAGHTPVVLAGGGTGLIGDPSGKSAERQLQTPETVAENVKSQSRIFGQILDFDGPTPAQLVNNADWLTTLSFIDVLRDVGKHFSVNAMIERDSVKTRLTTREQGISYTEFSYMILQAYDFLHLHREQGITIQLGGSDQWGNIVAGTDLIRKSTAVEVALKSHRGDGEFDRDGLMGAMSVSTGSSPMSFGLTAPLVTKADGGKFGKTETGAIWLTPDRTSPYAYYQFWLNTADADVGPFLRTFTLLSREEIEALEQSHAEAPHKRDAQRALAQNATTILHGEAKMLEAEAAGKALFSGDLASLSRELLIEVLAAVPASDHLKASLEGTDLVALLVETGLAKSNREAREFIASGSVSINAQKADEGRTLSSSDLLHNEIIAIRRGKKAWHVTRWQ